MIKMVLTIIDGTLIKMETLQINPEYCEVIRNLKKESYLWLLQEDI